MLWPAFIALGVVSTFGPTCSGIGVGRNVSIVARVSQESALPVVVPTGVYGRDNFAPPEHQKMTEDELTALFVKELREGIEDTGIKAGFIKIATGSAPMTALEEKFLRAAGRAASQTGAAIAGHTPVSSNASRQAAIQELLTAGHGDRILLSHDAGWYQPGQPNGGLQKGCAYLIDTFIPKLRAAGVDDPAIRMITETNPIRAFGVRSSP
jgi:phosphotriesterase-related protein